MAKYMNIGEKTVKNKTGKILKSTLAASFAFSLVTANPVQILAAPQEADDVTVDVYPKPQEITYTSGEGMSLIGEVNVVVHGEQESATLPKLEKILKENGISYVISDQIDDSKANILISSENDHCSECADEIGGNSEALNEEQGYILSASNDVNEKGEIKIIGADSDGAYYGLMTLTQMLEQKTADNKIAETVISDYPSIKLRGFVEGFYGYPWSYEDRLSLMSDSSKYKMNTYIYAPKDDPYHKAQWRELYPADKAEELRQLAAEGQKDNMSFCWSVHPGDGFNYSNDNDYNALINKFEQLYSLGVRQFGISYDDLGGYVNGQQHADLINRVNREWVQVKGDVKPLIVVGTRYCNGWGPSMSTYFKPFFSTLDDDVVVMWTGANTMSAITKDAYEWPKTQTGVTDKDLAAWWNYPVNDYCDGNLMMSPLENLDNDVDNLSGFFLNPMSQAEASKVAIFSGADYSWNVSGFERTSSWVRAIDELVPEASEAFQRFADNVSYIKDGFEFDESRYLVDKIDAFKTALQNKEGIKEAANTLKAEFTTMKNDVQTLRNINNKNLYEEIEQHLNAYEAVAEAGIASMQAFIDAEDGNIDECLTNINTTEIKLKEAQNYTVTSLETNGTKENVVKVGEKRIKPLLNDSIEQIKSNLMDNVFPETKATVIGTMSGLTDKTVEINQGNYELNSITGTMKANDTVGIALPKAMKVATVSLTVNNPNNLQIQSSINGLTWTDCNSEVDGSTLKANIDATATYIRVINKNTNNIDISIEKMIVAPVYNTGVKSVSTDLGTYGNDVIANAFDGNVHTKFYSSAGATVGSYIRVDLGKEIPLYDTAIYYAGNPKGPAYGIDGFAATKMEISTDGVSWKQVGDIIKDENYESKTVDGQLVSVVQFNANGEMARYIKFSATESSENWVQVFEIPFNETVDNLGDDSVDIIKTTITSGDTSNLYDRDLTSAFAPESVNDGDTLNYAMTSITNVGKLMIMQDPNAVCNATVSVQDVDGNWSDIGTLDKGTNTFDVNKQIVEMKLTFHNGNPVPVIYEIIVQENTEVEEADKTALKIAIDKANEITDEDLANVVPVVVEEFKAAREEANAVYNNESATQEQVNNAFDRLANAMQKLEFFKGDKKALEAFVNKVNNLEQGKYTEASWQAFEAALNKADKVLADENALETEVNEAYDSLVRAFLDLRLIPNKDLLNDLINKAEGLEAANYTADSFKAMQEALNNAKAIAANENATQAEVDNAKDVLAKAIDGLQAVNNTVNTPAADNKVTSLSNGDTTSVKTGDSTNLLGAFGIVSSLSVIAYLKKKKRK